MSVARTSVRLGEGVVVRPQAFVRDSGEPCGWLDVGGDAELGVYGSPGALRRMAAALLIAADAAEELVDDGECDPAAAA